VLLLTEAILAAMVADCIDGFPLEACGLLVGVTDRNGEVSVTLCIPAHNAARSARVYTVEPRDLLKADRRAEALGAELVGVYHSHTHTDAYPSPTDVAQAPDPAWHYVLVSLRDGEPSVRSFRIRDGQAEEETVVLE
jgi:proteasome lid subunit RPN8/RPN11